MKYILTGTVAVVLYNGLFKRSGGTCIHFLFERRPYFRCQLPCNIGEVITDPHTICANTEKGYKVFVYLVSLYC
jgi:hypothetical protein